MQAQGGSLAFIDASSRLEDGNAGRKSVEVLTYINGAHEYVLLDPFGESAPIRCTSQPESLVDFGETGEAVVSCKSFYALPVHIVILFECEIFPKSFVRQFIC